MRSLLLALAVAAAALALSAPAFAGTLQVRDEAHVLSASDRGALQSVVGGAPFDARLVLTSAYPSAPDLSRYVGSLVAEPDMVVVGVDPEHHHVQVHFGTGSGVPRSAWPSIERAGNDAFRAGEWESGAAAIFRAASGAVGDGAQAPGPAATPAAHSRLVPVMVFVGLAAVVGIAALSFARRRSAYSRGPGYGAYDPSGAPPYGPGYPPGYGPAYGAGYAPQGGMSPLAAGAIGAGLGGLAGYELGKLEGEGERDRAPGGAGGFTDPSGGGSFDDGGPGDFDAGGGGSDWDDGGGGGFDGGDSGGGSDF